MSDMLIHELAPARTVGPTIQITDGDQFVPLCVIDQTMNTNFSRLKSKLTRRNYYSKRFPGDVISTGYGPQFVEGDRTTQLRTFLLDVLDEPIPTSYRISYPFGFLAGHPSTQLFGGDVMAVKGDVWQSNKYYRRGCSFIFHPGRTRLQFSRYPNNPEFNDSYCIPMPVSTFLSASVLTLVKAKHLSYMKACAYLEIAPELPEDDIVVFHDVTILQDSVEGNYMRTVERVSMRRTPSSRIVMDTYIHGVEKEKISDPVSIAERKQILLSRYHKMMRVEYAN